MLSCLNCRKAFVYGVVRQVDTPLEQLVANDLRRFWGAETPNSQEISQWVDYLSAELSQFEIDTIVVYFDGRYMPVKSGPVEFVGTHSVHRLSELPHFEAVTQPSRLLERLGSRDYWLERKRPELIIVAGPNGAGKTTFANEYVELERERFVYINADEIAQELNLDIASADNRDFRAAREMLHRIDEAIVGNHDLVIETTLATRIYAQKIPAWRLQGYRVKLFYLRLPTTEHSIARVHHRVKLGGHSIPDDTIRRRFTKSNEYLETKYKQIVDEWYVWDSEEGNFKQYASWMD